MENGRFEAVFPIEHGDIPASYVSLPEGSWFTIILWSINDVWSREIFRQKNTPRSLSF